MTGARYYPDLPWPDRLLARIERHGPSECWSWQGSQTTDGYGKVHHDRHVFKAHRVVYEALVGPIPAGLTIDHLCRNRGCVNPAHMEPVTSAENTRRGARAKTTHCPVGHPYDEANTYRDVKGRRTCRACNRVAVARSYARRHASTERVA